MNDHDMNSVVPRSYPIQGSFMLDEWRTCASPLDYEQKPTLLEERPPRQLSSSCGPIRFLELVQHLPFSPMKWMYLILLGFIAAISGFLMDASTTVLIAFRSSFLDHTTIQASPFLACIVWCAWCLGFALLSSYLSWKLSGGVADGSGIPQIKRLLFHPALVDSDFLSLRTTGLGKSLGAVAAMTSGLSLGKEGPFLHIMAIVAHELGSMRFFQPVGSSHSKHKLMCIQAGIAAGVTAVFGTPLGGLLFSIETTAFYYDVGQLWQGVICTSVCVLTFELINVWNEDVLFQKTAFAGFEIINFELVAFLFLGVVTGLIAALFIKCVSFWNHWRKTNIPKRLNTRWIYLSIVAIVSALLTYPFSHSTDRVTINRVFNDGTLENSALELGMYILMKFVVTVLPCDVALPSGIFTPVFTLGAACGRLYGEILAEVFDIKSPCAAYAVVGAAALTSATTHTVSTAVIVFELTGQLSHMLPVMLTVLVAYSVGGMFNSALSIYDALADLRGLMPLPFLHEDKVSMRLIHEEVESGEHRRLTLASTYEELERIVQAHSQECRSVGLVPLCALDGSVLGGMIVSDMAIVLKRRREKTPPQQQQQRGEIKINNVIQMDKSTEIQMLVSLGYTESDEHDIDSSCDIEPKEQGFGPSNQHDTIQYGPPYGPLSYISLPVDSSPPTVTHLTPLHSVLSQCCQMGWIEFFVIKYGKFNSTLRVDDVNRRSRRNKSSSKSSTEEEEHQTLVDSSPY